MRADNDWEDSLGKKLHDFEGKLTPGAWNKIQKEIKPRRPRWVIWLPLLLLLILPASLYFFNNGDFVIRPQIAGTQTETGINDAAENSGKPAIRAENKNSGSGKTNGPVNAALENLPALSQAKEVPGKVSATQQPAQLTGKQKPVNEKTPAFIALIPEKEELVYSPEGKKKTVRKPALYAGVISRAGKAATLAKEENYAKSGKVKTVKPLPGETETSLTNLQSAVAVSKGVYNTEKSAAGTDQNADLNVEENKQVSGYTAAKTPAAKNGEIQILQTLISQLPFAANNWSGIPVFVPATEDSVIILSKATTEKQNDSTNKNEDKLKKNWAFSIYAMPQYTYLRVSPNTSDNIQVRKLNNKNKFSEERIGYEAGMLLSYPLTKKTALESGFHFTYLNQYLLLSASSPTADSMVVSYQNGTVTGQAYNREIKMEHRLQYYFGGLYLGAKTAILQGIHATGGIGTNWLLHSKITPEGTSIPSVNLNPYLSAGLQVNVPVSTGLNFQFGPTVQYYLRSVQADAAAFGAKPTVFGISAGLQLKR